MTNKTKRLPYDPGGLFDYASAARAAATPLNLQDLREARGGRHLSYEEGADLIERDRRTGGYDPARDADVVEQVTQGPLSDFANSGMQTGLPFMDEIGSGLNAPFWAVKDWLGGEGFDIPRSYHRSQALQEELQDRREDRSPIASAAGSIVGGAPLGATAAKAGLTLLNGAKATLGSLAGRASVEAGGYGALYGAGEGRSLAERADSAATGGAIGAGFGLAAPYLGKAAVAGAETVVDGVSAALAKAGRPSPSITFEKIRDMFNRAGISLSQNGAGGRDPAHTAAAAQLTAEPGQIPPMGTRPQVPSVHKNQVLGETDPPIYPQRPFSADYPNGADADATGRLTLDVEGDPITAKYVVGRVTVDGEDQPLGQAAMEDVARSLSQVKHPRGYRLQPLGGEDLGKDGAGVTILHDGIPHEIVLGEELSERERRLVLAHETGHAFYDTAKTGYGGRDIEAKDIWTELEQNYHSNQTGHRWPADPAKRADSLIEPNSGERVLMRTPESDGYSEDQFLHELLAEAYRTAALAPNTMKTLWPETMATLRAVAKSHPQLRQLIQFNGLVGGAILGNEALNADGLGAASKRRARDTF